MRNENQLIYESYVDSLNEADIPPAFKMSATHPTPEQEEKKREMLEQQRPYMIRKHDIEWFNDYLAALKQQNYFKEIDVKPITKEGIYTPPEEYPEIQPNLKEDTYYEIIDIPTVKTKHGIVNVFNTLTQNKPEAQFFYTLKNNKNLIIHIKEKVSSNKWFNDDNEEFFYNTGFINHNPDKMWLGVWKIYSETKKGEDAMTPIGPTVQWDTPEYNKKDIGSKTIYVPALIFVEGTTFKELDITHPDVATEMF